MNHNLHLLVLINAEPGLGSLALALAMTVADWLIYLIPLAMTVAWVLEDRWSRRELFQMLSAALSALSSAQICSLLWPQPRPFALHIGTQYLAHSNDPGMPSDHVTVFWALAFA